MENEELVGITLIYEAIVRHYNRRKGLFKKKLTNLDLIRILSGRSAPQGISATEVILAAKAICKGASVVCPFVEKL